MVNTAATAGSQLIIVPSTVSTESASIAYFVASWCSVMSALPRAKRFVDAAVGIVSCLSAGELLLHAGHSFTK